MDKGIQLVPKHSLILTKIQPPLLRRTVMPRERLAALVRGARERRLTLVSAGAGYGKTTVIASSLADTGLPLVWYSLSRSDNDIIVFLSYLIHALDRQWPGLAEAVRSSLAAKQVSAVQPLALLTACINELSAAASSDFLLVLDDFQLIDQTPIICQALDQFLSFAPPQAHLVIATRTAPAISLLPRLRAEGEALEIREEDLQFTTEEAASLFEESLHLELTESTTRQLVEQIEGWALGLLLAGQSIKGTARSGQATRTATLPENAADRRVLFEYLGEEVMRQQPPDIVDFMTSSAILSRLEPAICDAALGRVDSAQHIQHLEKHCLFVIRTPDGYLRYHRLFREFLLQHLANDPDRLRALHRRAAAFFQEKQESETAVNHWLQAGDYGEAARLISLVAEEMLAAGRLNTLGFWFSRLPESELADLPDLWIRQGQMYEARGEWDLALEYYERAVQAFTARGDLVGLSDVLRSKGHVLDWREGEHVEAERLHRTALSYVGEEYRRKRAALLASLSRDQLSAGNTTAAETLYHEALALHGSDRQGQLDTLLNPGSWLFHSLGDFSQAIMALRRAEQLALELTSSRQLTEVYNNLSVNLYYSGRYQEALEYADKALGTARELGDTHQTAYALMNQANGLEMTCRLGYTELYEQYERALQMEQALGNRRFIIAILVFMMILTRRGGDANEAARRGAQALLLARERSLRWLTGFVLVQMGAAQIWIDSDMAGDSLEQAHQILSDCGDRYHLMVTYFWLAVLYHSENNSVFVRHLRECLQLAVAHHYDYYFRTEIQASIPLLVSALEHDLWPSYVTPILVKLGPDVVEPLRALLAHNDRAVRDRAEIALKAMGVTIAPARAGGAAPSRRKQPAIPLLTIQALGNFSVWRGDQIVEEREWGRRKCKRLLKYLALSPQHTVSKDTAMELLWGDSDPQAANANFYRTLYNLRRVLEPLSPHSSPDYIVLEGGAVSLVENLIAKIDTEEFGRGVEEGRRLVKSGDLPGARSRLAEAVALYRDDLSTDDLYDDWLQPPRERLRQICLDALGLLADLSGQAGDMDAAAEYMRQVFRKDKTCEDACRKLMHFLIKTGRRGEALQNYGTLEKALAELSLVPSSELKKAQQELLEERVTS